MHLREDFIYLKPSQLTNITPVCVYIMHKIETMKWNMMATKCK